MDRLCVRPGCSAPAVATFNFDGLRRLVWLGPLDRDLGRSAGDLCQRHADRFSAPQHWELHDLRSAQEEAAPACAPERLEMAPRERPRPLPPAIRPTAPLAPAAAASAPRTPMYAPPSRVQHSPAASTPLLARAFRASASRA